MITHKKLNALMSYAINKDNADNFTRYEAVAMAKAQDLLDRDGKLYPEAQQALDVMQKLHANGDNPTDIVAMTCKHFDIGPPEKTPSDLYAELMAS